MLMMIMLMMMLMMMMMMMMLVWLIMQGYIHGGAVDDHDELTC